MVALTISCGTVKGPPNPDFVKNCYSLRKGMRVDQVLKIMGEPIGSNTQPIHGVQKEGQVYHFHDNVSKQLMAVFIGDKLMTTSLSDQEDKFSGTKEIIPYNPNDFMPLKNRSNN